MKKGLIAILSVLIIVPCIFCGCQVFQNKEKDDGTYKEKDDVTYKVTFDFDNGQSAIIQTVKDGEKLNKPDDPIKKDTAIAEYEFIGWFIGDELWDFETRIVNKSLTLKARYTIKNYTGDLPIRR